MNCTFRIPRILRMSSAAVFAMWLCLLEPASASILVPMDLEALSGTADRILVGTVEKIESHYASPGSRYIVTDVTVRCDRNVLGVTEGTRFVVRHLGGVVGELGQRVHGEASFREGEEVLLFAAQRQGAYFSVGMAQGAMHIYRDSSGTARVATELAGAELLTPASGAASVAAPPAQGRPLQDVIAQVQGYLARRKSLSPGQSADHHGRQ